MCYIIATNHALVPVVYDLQDFIIGFKHCIWYVFIYTLFILTIWSPCLFVYQFILHSSILSPLHVRNLKEPENDNIS